MRVSVGVGSLLLVGLLLAGPASGQSEDEVTKAVGKELDAYTLCLKQHAHDLAKGSKDSEDIVIDQAIAACDAESNALEAKLQDPPLNWSPADAAEAVKGATTNIRPKIVATIKEARGA